MADESIPLYDGKLSGAKIIHEGACSAAGATPASSPSDGGGTRQTMRGKRRHARKTRQDVHVCFTPNEASGRIDFVECPLLNISRSGIAVKFERPLCIGMTCRIAYCTVSHRPVHVSGCVRFCGPMGDGYYSLGIKLDRYLDYEELKPAKSMPGRDVAPGLRIRKLK